MNKLKSAVLYECSTKIKAIGLFYLIQYLISALILQLLQFLPKEMKLVLMRWSLAQLFL